MDELTALSVAAEALLVERLALFALKFRVKRFGIEFFLTMGEAALVAIFTEVLNLKFLAELGLVF